MAERRMFSKKIIDSDAFLDMPMSARLLYYDLGMRADDDGFVGNPRRIAKVVGAQEDDLMILKAKRFVLGFKNGVIVIKHWRLSNTIRKDRYEPTIYQEEAQLLAIKENGVYTELDNLDNIDGIPYSKALATLWQPNGNQMVPQVRLGKVSIGKDRIIKEKAVVTAKERFTPPTLEEVTKYSIEKRLFINPEDFFNYYASNGWKVGRNKMVSWHGAIARWFVVDKEHGKGETWTDAQLDYIDEHREWADSLNKSKYEEVLV